MQTNHCLDCKKEIKPFFQYCYSCSVYPCEHCNGIGYKPFGCKKCKKQSKKTNTKTDDYITCQTC